MRLSTTGTLGKDECDHDVGTRNPNQRGKSMKSGCEAGSTERIETGCSVERAKIARNMKTKDCSVEVIAECTGLTEKDTKVLYHKSRICQRRAE